MAGGNGCRDFSYLDQQHLEIFELPIGKRSVGLKWLYKTKYTSDGQVLKQKARLVGKGYSQRHGIDYDEVLSP